jgi:hypothetical protein
MNALNSDRSVLLQRVKLVPGSQTARAVRRRAVHDVVSDPLIAVVRLVRCYAAPAKWWNAPSCEASPGPEVKPLATGRPRLETKRASKD